MRVKFERAGALFRPFGTATLLRVEVVLSSLTHHKFSFTSYADSLAE